MKTSAVVCASILGLISTVSAAATPIVSSDHSQCCHHLDTEYPDITYLDTGNQSVQYRAVLQSYFNVPSALPPNCFVQPTTANEVARVVSILSHAQCKFAVKGGGHGLYVGANGIKNGVTIDMREMRRTTLSRTTLANEQKTVTVEGGAKWGEVYKTLETLGYAIPGGRASDVGVGGLTLGGGNSFFAARYGFVCDNVKNFEIVLGNGTLTNANANKNADLFKALKGGSGNFGIVTRFDFYAFPSGSLWGGIAAYPYSTFSRIIEPFVQFTDNIASDPFGSLISLWQHNVTTNETSVLNLYEYTGNTTSQPPFYHGTDAPGTNNPFPSPFTNLTIPKLGAPVLDTLRTDSLYNLTAELNGPPGLRNIYSATTFKATVPIMREVNAIIERVLASVSSTSSPYEIAQAQYQPYPRVFTDHSLARGGNVLGLDRVKDNSILLSFILSWRDAAKDTAVGQVADWVLGNVTVFTREAGGFRPWQYLNYAYESQDPVGSYGEANVAFLREVSGRYDPAQVFQRLVPGGWKLGDAGRRGAQFVFNQFGVFAPQ